VDCSARTVAKVVNFAMAFSPFIWIWCCSLFTLQLKRNLSNRRRNFIFFMLR
jgi:hypothetical protein